MPWKIKVPDFEMDSDDMTIAELGRVEKISGTPWSVANPYRDVGVAKAFYLLALERSGASRNKAEKIVNELTLKDFKNAFEWIKDADDEEVEAEEPDPSVQPPETTIQGS
jgi:hypothetical protein